jgi:hypothetical protein
VLYWLLFALPEVPSWLQTALIAAATGGGVFTLLRYVPALFKIGPERKQMAVQASHEAVNLHSDVLKDVKDSYDNVADELAQLKMAVMVVEEERDHCKRQVQSYESTIRFLQSEVERHGRLTERLKVTADIARQRSHYAVGVISNYEIHNELVLSEFRKREIPVTPMMRTKVLREAFHLQMEKFN